MSETAECLFVNDLRHGSWKQDAYLASDTVSDIGLEPVQQLGCAMLSSEPNYCLWKIHALLYAGFPRVYISLSCMHGADVCEYEVQKDSSSRQMARVSSV